MKTYWLEKREHRSSSTKGITFQEPPQWHTRSTEKRVSAGTPAAFNISTTIYENQNCLDASSSRRGSKIGSPTPAESTFIPEERRIYSPITFQDVARRSVANSPTKNADSRGKQFCYLYDIVLFYENINIRCMRRLSRENISN